MEDPGPSALGTDEFPKAPQGDPEVLSKREGQEARSPKQMVLTEPRSTAAHVPPG